jgi:hypothetical protein
MLVGTVREIVVGFMIIVTVMMLILFLQAIEIEELIFLIILLDD